MTEQMWDRNGGAYGQVWTWNGTNYVKTAHARDPLREAAKQACDDAQTQVNQWAREVTHAQNVIAELTAENDVLRAERDQALYELELLCAAGGLQ